MFVPPATSAIGRLNPWPHAALSIPELTSLVRLSPSPFAPFFPPFLSRCPFYFFSLFYIYLSTFVFPVIGLITIPVESKKGGEERWEFGTLPRSISVLSSRPRRSYLERVDKSGRWDYVRGTLDDTNAEVRVSSADTCAQNWCATIMRPRFQVEVDTAVLHEKI